MAVFGAVIVKAIPITKQLRHLTFARCAARMSSKKG
jgi:hypothetical protein